MWVYNAKKYSLPQPVCSVLATMFVPLHCESTLQSEALPDFIFILFPVHTTQS